VPTGKGYAGLVQLCKEHGARVLRLAAHWSATEQRPEEGADPWAWFTVAVREELTNPVNRRRWDPRDPGFTGTVPTSSSEELDVSAPVAQTETRHEYKQRKIHARMDMKSALGDGSRELTHRSFLEFVALCNECLSLQEPEDKEHAHNVYSCDIERLKSRLEEQQAPGDRGSGDVAP